jgi:hypothetical protein
MIFNTKIEINFKSFITISFASNPRKERTLGKKVESRKEKNRME